MQTQRVINITQLQIEQARCDGEENGVCADSLVVPEDGTGINVYIDSVDVYIDGVNAHALIQSIHTLILGAPPFTTNPPRGLPCGFLWSN